MKYVSTVHFLYLCNKIEFDLSENQSESVIAVFELDFLSLAVSSLICFSKYLEQY